MAFLAVYQEGDPGQGIGGYDLKSSADRVFAFDYDRSGKLDHLALYRPGTGTMWILKNSAGAFTLKGTETRILTVTRSFFEFARPALPRGFGPESTLSNGQDTCFLNIVGGE